MTLRTGFYYDPFFLQHDTGQHPENAGRLQSLLKAIEGQTKLQSLVSLQPRAAEEKEIELIHDLRYIQSVKESCAEGEPFIGSMDCAISKETFAAAKLATGAVLDAVEKVARGQLDNAFCAVRPPGHHAEHAEAMGFCYFNNVAIAAEYLRRELGMQRVLIFDFDVHHGNGTQHSFEARKDVMYASIHQDPRTCYPGTGYASERGHGEGQGYTLNFPMQPYSGDEDYSHVLQQRILPLFREYQPDFVLLSSGFDAHRDDPLAQIELTVNGFDEIVQGMKELAFKYAGGRLVSVLEGGYNYRSLAECVTSHLQLLLDDPQ